NWQTKAEVGSLQLTKAAIFDIQSHEDFIFLATGDGAVIKVDLHTNTVLQRVSHAVKSARCLAVNAGANELAVGYSDHYIRVFDLATLQLRHEWKAHENSVFTIRYTPDGQTLLSGSRDARLKAWNAAAGYTQQAEVVAHMYAINHIEFSPAGKHFVTCSMDKSIKVWDVATLSLLKVIDKARHAGHGTSVNKLLWTSHHNQLVSASDDRSLSVWNLTFQTPSI
ncbi:MAG: WD40 repeat domain-containing protein, partial [Bacteroidia bacterium]|nr:WD40 repeat domain-containing protein [Bacteroidia bacterium]